MSIKWTDKREGTNQTNAEYASALRNKGYTWSEIAEHLGCGIDSVRKSIRYHTKPELPPLNATNPPPEPDCFEPDIPPVSIEDALKIVEDHGYNLQKHATATNRTAEITANITDGNTHKIGLISDTHLSSQHCQMSTIRNAYEYFRQNDIDTVFHSGDLCAGQHMYRGQEYELINHGADRQIEYFVNEYPQVDGITTHFIIGNHDTSFLVGDGIDIGKAISRRRDDLVYHGVYSATMNYGGLKIGLLHPDGGGSYARSYKIQKIIEQLSSQNKPHILVAGHYHTNVVLPMYRNVYCIQIGCTESQTPYLMRKGLYPEVGFGVLEFKSDESGALEYSYRWRPTYICKTEDY